MLYTIMPPEIVCAVASNAIYPEIFRINGITVEGTRNKDCLMVSRIISSNPKDYINNMLYPGIIIKIK